MDTIIQAVTAVMGPDVDWKQVFLIGMTPFFVLGLAVEWQVLRRRGQTHSYRLREMIANVSLGSGYQLMELVMWVLITGSIFAFVYQFRLFDVPVNGWTVLPIFIAVEFCYYWFHRASHRIRWFWSAHVVHHTGEVMNMSTAARQSLLNALVGTWLFYLPPVILGVPPAVVMFMLAVNLAYQWFIHTEAVGRLPRWMEYVFDTPSNHRVHHGRNPEYIDRNYGGVLIVFDRLFGTYEEERAPVDYGIPHQIRSYNFLVLNVHEFVDMLRDAWHANTARQRLKHLLAPPDWQPPGQSGHRTWTTERRTVARPDEPEQDQPRSNVTA